jgi:cell division protein ZapA (FtsZ GTPase activity inhibitor)
MAEIQAFFGATGYMRPLAARPETGALKRPFASCATLTPCQGARRSLNASRLVLDLQCKSMRSKKRSIGVGRLASMAALMLITALAHAADNGCKSAYDDGVALTFAAAKQRREPVARTRSSNTGYCSGVGTMELSTRNPL